METTVTDIGSVRHRLEGTVLVDRAWAREIGASQAKGARRVGNFYRLPRAEYVRLLNGASNGARSYQVVDDQMKWTRSDDVAVAELLREAAQQAEQAQDSECVGCS
jgi:hypothetical protein